jgi:hypothetical protein
LRPGVDRIGGDTELLCGMFDADLPVLYRNGAWSEDMVDATNRSDVTGSESQVPAGAQAGVVEHLRDLLVAVSGTVLAHDCQGLRRGAAWSSALENELVGSAGMPAHPDSDRFGIGFWQQGHIRDQGA